MLIVIFKSYELICILSLSVNRLDHQSTKPKQNWMVHTLIHMWLLIGWRLFSMSGSAAYFRRSGVQKYSSDPNQESTYLNKTGQFSSLYFLHTRSLRYHGISIFLSGNAVPSAISEYILSCKAKECSLGNSRESVHLVQPCYTRESSYLFPIDDLIYSQSIGI